MGASSYLIAVESLALGLSLKDGPLDGLLRLLELHLENRRIAKVMSFLSPCENSLEGVCLECERKGNRGKGNRGKGREGRKGKERT